MNAYTDMTQVLLLSIMFPGQFAAACLGGGLHWKNIMENVRQPLFVVSFPKRYVLEFEQKKT